MYFKSIFNSHKRENMYISNLLYELFLQKKKKKHLLDRTKLNNPHTLETSIQVNYTVCHVPE